MIDWNLEFLAKQGARKVFINLHYRGEQIKAFVKDGSYWGLQVRYSEEVAILDSGGAIKNIEEDLSNDALLTFNSDILIDSSLSLPNLVRLHKENRHAPKATLVLRPDSEASVYGEFGINAEGRICSFRGCDYLPGTSQRGLMYCGVQVLSRRTIASMPPKGTPFGIFNDTYINELKNGGYLSSITFEGYWTDVGTPEALKKARERL